MKSRKKWLEHWKSAGVSQPENGEKVKKQN